MFKLDNDSKYLKAKERVDNLKKFYSTLLKNIFVIVLTGAINYYTNEWRYPWFLWVVFGVSIGTIIQAIKLFGYQTLFGRNWEERKIQEFMKDEENKRRWE